MHWSVQQNVSRYPGLGGKTTSLKRTRFFVPALERSLPRHHFSFTGQDNLSLLPHLPTLEAQAVICRCCSSGRCMSMDRYGHHTGGASGGLPRAKKRLRGDHGRPRRSKSKWALERHLGFHAFEVTRRGQCFLAREPFRPRNVVLPCCKTLACSGIGKTTDHCT